MPIIEDPEVAFKETRLVELTEIKKYLISIKTLSFRCVSERLTSPPASVCAAA